ncbi:hypothetical protein N178_11160 [Priestia aryabhattai B8W22]|nr:hypothetical protein N178_11160 [Priestia aryabhattai B8W22]
MISSEGIYYAHNSFIMGDEKVIKHKLQKGLKENVLILNKDNIGLKSNNLIVNMLIMVLQRSRLIYKAKVTTLKKLVFCPEPLQ